eukprot:15393092-Alexandrium_andersonii.AAC.1
MSASLVGSEMCIRDRPHSAPLRNPPCVNCKLASGVRTWNCAGPGMGSKPVSYTHLTLPTICSV